MNPSAAAQTVLFFSGVTCHTPRYRNEFSAVSKSPPPLFSLVYTLAGAIGRLSIAKRSLISQSVPNACFHPRSPAPLLLAARMTVTCSPLSSNPPFPSAGIKLDVFGHDCNYLPSTVTSDDDDSDDEDEDECNVRVAPHWQAYRHLFESRGYHLDTCKDVRQFYLRYWETGDIQHEIQSLAGYRSASREGRDDNELCKDEGLVSFFSPPPVSPLVVWYLTTTGLLATVLVLGSAVQALLLNYDGDKLISIRFRHTFRTLILPITFCSRSACSAANACRTIFPL